MHNLFTCPPCYYVLKKKKKAKAQEKKLEKRGGREKTRGFLTG